ncbi:hypothetical protein BC831DRAFT_447426 [Entophlyctis helioformis]|nr:hypothetical protein BC831DRAFT_447426 [Entophlyctis helioformis]
MASTAPASASAAAAATLPPTGKAFVKNVLSGDSLVLRGKPVRGPPPELVFSLAGLSAPRLGTAKEPEKEEAFAFEAREFLRRALVGKEIAYKTEYTTASNGRPFGSLTLRFPINGETSVARLLVKEGWVRVRAPDGKRQPTEVAALEQEAQAAKKGLWSEKPSSRNVSFNFTGEPRAFLEKRKGKQIDAVIEQVRDGSTYRVLLVTPDGKGSFNHQYITLALSGIKCPIHRKDIPNMEDLVEPYAEEAKFFVEARLLQRDVKVTLESIASSGNPPTFVGSVSFPAGSIAEALLSEGLAKVVDWNLAIVSGEGAAAAYRAAEEKAKAKKLRLWTGHVKAAAGGAGAEFDAIVTRILGADLLSIEPVATPGKERKVQLSSVRGPKRTKNEAGFETGYYTEAVEFLRSRLIGKKVHVRIDYVKPAEGEYEARDCVTILNGEQNVGEALVGRGLANVIRHRKDDNSRSAAYDKLVAAEERALKATKGVHSTKEVPVHRIVDASENAAKSKQFLPYFQRSGSITGIVEFVSSGGRFRVFVPSQSCRMTFVLGGVRVPRTGRANEKSEPYGPEAADFSTRHALQREVEVIVEGVDKVGGFIGSMMVKTATSGETDKTNIAVALLERGFATVHEYSASQSQFTNQLFDAEARAKTNRVGVWTDYDPVAELQQQQDSAAAEALAQLELDAEKSASALETHTVHVSEISGASLYLQVVGPELQKLERLMSEFAAHHASAAQQAHEPFTPRVNDYCSAQFSADKCWYRGRVRRVNGPNSYTVFYIDYGNSETVPGSRLRPLPPRFAVTAGLKPQAVEAKLAYIDLPDESAEVAADAFGLLRSATESGPVTAAVMSKGPVWSVVLYETPGATSTAVSVNEALVREGLAHVSKPVMKRWELGQRNARKNPGALLAATWGARAAPVPAGPPGAAGSSANGSAASTRGSTLDCLVEAQEAAKRERLNLWQYGDFTADEDM